MNVTTSADMEFMQYIMNVDKLLERDHPNRRTRTIEDYLEAVAAVSPPFVTDTKSLPTAEQSRNEGNFIFSLGDYEEAASIYTHSLKAAPPYSACSALAYANRSAALYHLGAFEECIADIDRALNLPYPNELRQKIITRKKTAVAKLKNISDRERGRNSAAANNIEYAYGENAKLPGVSLGIGIACRPRSGRGLVAKKPFQPGDILFTEKPYWAVPISQVKICHHCLKTSLCLIPCDRCCYAVYCSENCREEAHKNYHRIECNIRHTLSYNGLSDAQAIHFSLRCLIVLTAQGANFEALYNDFEEIEKNPDSARLAFTEEQFMENKEKVILSSEINQPKQPSIADFFGVAYTVALLRNYTDFFKTNADVPRSAKLLMKLYTICTRNCSQIPFPGERENKAFGGFPLISLADHACSNNTIAYMDKNDRIVVRASHYIRPGAQIRCSYHFTTLFIDQIGDRSKILQCKRYCRKCDETFSFPLQRRPCIQVDKSLRHQLRKNSYDIESLWKLLKLLCVNNLAYRIQIEMLKVSLIQAYEGLIDHASGLEKLRMLGIL